MSGTAPGGPQQDPPLTQPAVAAVRAGRRAFPWGRCPRDGLAMGERCQTLSRTGVCAPVPAAWANLHDARGTVVPRWMTADEG